MPGLDDALVARRATKAVEQIGLDLQMRKQQVVLEGEIAAFSAEDGPIVDVRLRVGDASLLARITRRSRDQMALAEGQRVYALIKAVSFDRRSVGYA